MRSLRKGYCMNRTFLRVIFSLVFLGIMNISAGELSEESRREVDGAIQTIAKITGNDVVQLQDDQLRKLETKYANNPEELFWARRGYYFSVIFPSSKTGEGVKRYNEWLSKLDEWIANEKMPPEILARYQALRLTLIATNLLREDAPQWLPKLAKIEWRPYESDYFTFVSRWHREILDRNIVDEFHNSWQQIFDITGKYAEHPRTPILLVETLTPTWSKRPTILPPAELTALLKPLTSEVIKLEKIDPRYWEGLIAIAARTADEGGDFGFANELLGIAQAKFPDQAWVWLGKSRHSQVLGESQQAIKERSRAVLFAIETATPQYTYIIQALRDEFDMAFATENWSGALGVSRSLFNVARTETELALSLDFAARVMANTGGGIEPTVAFLGLIREGEAKNLPESWQNASGNTIWKEILTSSIILPDDIETQPATWRRRALLYLTLGDGKSALDAATTAYRLPDLNFGSQQMTLELLGLAMRAKTGSLLSTSDFVNWQMNGGKVSASLRLPKVKTSLENQELISKMFQQLQDKAVNNLASIHLCIPEIQSYAAALSLAGNIDEGLAVMRCLYSWAQITTEFDQSCAGIVSMLRAKDDNLVRSNAWLQYQRYGPAGQDGVIGNEDDLIDPLATLAWNIPPAWSSYWTTTAQSMQSRGDLRNAVRLYLMAGSLVEAKKLTRQMRLALPFQESAWKDHLNMAAIVIKADVGHTFAGQKYADFLRYGQAGPDGKLGTADDISDPFVIAK